MYDTKQPKTVRQNIIGNSWPAHLYNSTHWTLALDSTQTASLFPCGPYTMKMDISVADEVFVFSVLWVPVNREGVMVKHCKEV